MWSRRISTVDWVIIAVTAVLAALTLYAASYPVVGSDAFLLLNLAWSLPAIALSLSLLGSAEDMIARAAAAALLVGSVASVAFLGFSLFVLILFGSIGIAAAAALAIALFAVVVVRSPNRCIAWLVAPSIVLVTLALLITGLPRMTRLWLAEPALTAYAEQIEGGGMVELPAYFDEPVSVGGIPIYEIYVEGGHLHFVTDYVGILADDGAGLAYLPSGAPEADPPYDHLPGPWYRWSPTSVTIYQ
jgi:hypothetical protein